MMQATPSFDADEMRATACLVLADGTIFHGIGLGGEGDAKRGRQQEGTG